MKTTARTILIALFVFLISRSLVRALPGDPLDSLLSETALSVPRELIAAELGLDRSFLSSLLHDLSGFLRGDLGRSLITREPVSQFLLPRLLNSLALALGSMILAISCALPAGVWCAVQHVTPQRRQMAQLLRLFATLSVSVPLFWVGPLVLYVFSVAVPLGDFRGSYTLACIALALQITGSWIRIIELRVREEMQQPYFQVALSRGISPFFSVSKYALAPAAGAFLAMLGSQFGSLLSGAFVAEWIFDRPGLGSAWVQALLQRDYPVIEAATLLGGLCCLAGTQIGDWLQSRWDPRTKQNEVVS